ncbi:MAG TPA: zinc ribbon domain-containing protein [Clostridia bacterium]|nr:zinc ribbon domain-containing protein [Clostridia bacterium]
MENLEMKFCQSCAMPIENEAACGTNSDGSKNGDYCQYCLENGKFTFEGSMQDMIEACVPYVSKGEPYADEESARKAMNEIFPKLKRWKQD